MRLLNCHVNGFGKLENQDFNFSEDVNVICKDNGWGKSTLCTFIRVMLYGFRNEGKQDSVINERKHYKPWGGAIYGGRIAVEAAGTRYSITRTFGNKKQDDTIEVRNMANNMVAEELGDEPGRVLFDIDMESFIRTAFVTSNDCATSVTDNINAKLGNLTDNTDDINNYDKIMKRIADELNYLTPSRKTGELKKIELEMAELSHDLRNKEMIEKSISEIEEKKMTHRDSVASFRERLESLGILLEKESKLASAKEKRTRYEELIKNKSDRELQIKDIATKFKNDIPEEEAIVEMQNLCDELSKAKGEFDSARLTEPEKDKLSLLHSDFISGVPTDEELKDIEGTITKLRELDKKIRESELPKEDKRRLDELGQLFSKGKPEKKEIENIINLVQERTDLIQDLDRIKTKQDMLELQNVVNKEQFEKGIAKKKNTLLIVGLLALLCGVAVFFLLVALLRYVGIALGVIGFILIVMSFMTKGEYTPDLLLSETRESATKTEDSIAKLNNTIVEFADNYGFGSTSAQLIYTLMDAAKSVDEYERLVKLSNECNPEPYYEERNQNSDKIIALLAKYNEEVINEEYASAANRLVNKRKEYQYLSKQQEKADESQTKIRKLRNDIEGFLNSLGIRPKNDKEYPAYLREISELLVKYKGAYQELESATKAKSTFEEENPEYEEYLKPMPESSGRSLTDINDERAKLDRNIEEELNHIKEYENRIEELSQSLDVLYEKEARLFELKEKKIELEDRYSTFSNVKKYLEEAKENLTNRYTGPIMEAFNKYYKMLDVASNEEYHLDARINLTRDEAGHQRDTGFLSSGLQDMVGLCMRLSLIKAMYQGEKPFLIMDDPLNNMDSEKTKCAKNLLNELGKEYQIIYFTCNESRL